MLLNDSLPLAILAPSNGGMVKHVISFDCLEFLLARENEDFLHWTGADEFNPLVFGIGRNTFEGS